MNVVDLQGKPMQIKETEPRERIVELAELINRSVEELRHLAIQNSDAFYHARPKSAIGAQLSMGAHLGKWVRTMQFLFSILDNPRRQ